MDVFKTLEYAPSHITYDRLASKYPLFAIFLRFCLSIPLTVTPSPH